MKTFYTNAKIFRNGRFEPGLIAVEGGRIAAAGEPRPGRPGGGPRGAAPRAGAGRRACAPARAGLPAEGDHCDGYGRRGPRGVYHGLFDAQPEPCARYAGDARRAAGDHPPRRRGARETLRYDHDGPARMRRTGRFRGLGPAGRRLLGRRPRRAVGGADGGGDAPGRGCR